MYRKEHYYNLHSRSWRGLFYPHYNLIWIKGDITNIEQTIEHEFFHAYSLSLKPSNNIMLYNKLCSTFNRPFNRELSINNFRDISEALVIVFQLVNSNNRSIKNITGEQEYRVLAKEIMYFINEISGYKSVKDNTNIKKEAFYGLMGFLLNVIPTKEGNGKFIIKYLRDNLPAFIWHNRYDLEITLFWTFYDIQQSEGSSLSLFSLNYPEIIHRSILDVFVFLKIFIITFNESKEKLLPFLLSILNIFSLGSLFILPVFYIKDKSIDIEIIHSNENNVSLLDNVTDNLKYLEARDVQRHCFSIRLFRQIIEGTKQIVILKDKNRIGLFLELFMKIVEKCLVNLQAKDYECRHCESSYFCAIKELKNERFINNGIINRVQLYKDMGMLYDNWLRGDIIKWANHVLEEDLIEFLKDKTYNPDFEYL